MAQGKSFAMENEFSGLDFHSIRLEERFIKTMGTLSTQPDKSIWESGENRAEAKAIYRMPGNENFDREGDMYELFAKAQSLNEPLLIRIVQNQMAVENKRTKEHEGIKKRRQSPPSVRLPRLGGQYFTSAYPVLSPSPVFSFPVPSAGPPLVERTGAALCRWNAVPAGRLAFQPALLVVGLLL